MKCRSIQIAFLLLGLRLAGEASAALSAWDETQLQLLQQYSAPVRWYNVEGPPYWVAGPEPRHDFGTGLHLIHLEPGEEVTLRATANTWLRLVGEAKTFSPADLEISVSTDARAFAAAASIRTSDPHELLIALPRDKASLVRLTRPSHAQSRWVFAACFLVEQPLTTLIPYREPIHFPGKAVNLRRDDETLAQPARLVKPEAGIEFSLEGPTRIQLVARLPWPADEPFREQSLIMGLKLDGIDSVPLLLSPELDVRHRTRVNHSTELVSYRMYGFLNVPKGKHNLRLQPDVPVYLSAFRQADPDFLLPSLNAPATNAMPDLKSVPADTAITPGSPSPLLSARDFVDQEQAAWRLARDNNPLDAGGQAADWLNRISQTRRDYAAARQTAALLWRQRTFYREVLPARQPGDPTLQRSFFSPARLMDLFEPHLPVAVCNPTLEQVRGLLAECSFASVPHALSPPLLYQLPARSFDSVLRLAAVAGEQARTHFFVQFDQELPVKVVLDPTSALPVEEIEPSAALATLRVLEHGAPVSANRELKQFAVGFDLPFPISEPGIIELPLPRDVRQVRIYQEPPATSVAASIAYRAAKPFELGEESYLSLLSQSSSDAVMRMLSMPQEPDPNAPEPLRQLHNHFLPLIRLLKFEGLDFARSVDLNSVPERTGPALPAEETSKLMDAARKLEKDGQPIEALEVWNRIFWEGAASDRPEAVVSIMRGLQSLGEDFQATQYARYALLKTPVPQAAAPAVALLEDNARQSDDTEQLEQVRAFLFTGCPCPGHLAGLIEAFALNSRDELVLSTGLLLPAEQRPNELMLAAALHLNWWQTFDRLVEALPEAEAKYFWRAQKRLAFHQFAEAEQDLKQAGGRGVEMLRAVQEGGHIRERLAAPDPKERLDALFAWEEWQSHQPGPKTWRNSEDIVYQCSATELLFNGEQNKFAQYFRTEPGKPVKLLFVGPAHLQIEARPVLELPFEKPVDDWLEISEYGITNRVPIFQCVPNPSQQLTATSNALAGLKTTADREWGPGLHEVEISLAGRTGLVRVLEEQPVLPARILPTINAERMNLVLGTGRKSLPAQLQTDAGLTAIQSLRLALRMKRQPEQSPNFSFADLQALPLAEQWLAACRWQRWSDFTNWNALPEIEQANYLLATHHIRQVLDSNAPRDIHQRLVTLLQVSEGFPAWRKEAQGLAEVLAAETNCPAGCKKILLRLTEDLTWVPLPISPSSAGIRRIDVASDLPQDPSSRIRRALLPPASTNEFTLSAPNAFTASMTLQHPARLQVRAGLAKVGFSPLTPLTVSMQVDALEVQPLPLTPFNPAAGTNFTLAEGPHLVRIWIEDPVANQFVRLSFAGLSESVTNSIWSQTFVETASESRFFHTATAAQPIRFSWKGPALLRLDEWREGRFLSQLRLLPPGEQTVEIPTAPGRAESWHRIFVRATQTNQPEVRPAWTIREPEAVPPPKLRLPETIPPASVRVTDYYRLGGQEDGTWTAGLVLARRRPFELGGQSNAVVNKFVEVNATYRKASQSETVWFSTETLARVHQPGDLTFGLAEQIEGRPQVSLFDWNWSGEAFAGSAGPQQQDIEGALYTAFELGPRFHLNRKLDYHPFAGLFAHYLTLSSARAAQYNYVDQDLFTRFRSQHRWGWTLGNQLDYQPWLDTLLRGDLDAASNEDLTPDHWGARFSWNQLFGPVRGEVAYRFTHFLADADRSSDAFRQGISAGLYAEHWLNGRHRLELGMQYHHDWPRSGDSYFLVLSWDFSHGRGYKDYGPGEKVFRDLRSRSIPAAFNNLFQPGPPGASLP